MTTTNPDKIGPRTALFVGFPIGIAFSLAILFISLFPMIDFGIAVIGGGLFWYPIVWSGLIPITFIFLLWKAGKKIKIHLDKNHSLIRTSFLFTLFVNSWLFGMILLIFITGGLFFNPAKTISPSNISLFAVGLTIFFYILATGVTTFTTGLLIVSIAKSKIYR